MKGYRKQGQKLRVTRHQLEAEPEQQGDQCHCGWHEYDGQSRPHVLEDLGELQRLFRRLGGRSAPENCLANAASRSMRLATITPATALSAPKTMLTTSQLGRCSMSSNTALGEVNESNNRLHEDIHGNLGTHSPAVNHGPLCNLLEL